MAITAQVVGAVPSQTASPGVTSGGTVTASVLEKPITVGERAAARQDLQLAQFSINIGIGNPAPPFLPVYPSVPTYYGWMGPAYAVVPPPAPGFVIIMHGGQYYRVPHSYWEQRDYHWHNHFHRPPPGRRW